jgi:hypothetical protein
LTRRFPEASLSSQPFVEAWMYVTPAFHCVFTSGPEKYTSDLPGSAAAADASSWLTIRVE